MHAGAGRLLLVLPIAALTGCNLPGEVGYVEIKTVPASPRTSPPLYLDQTRLEPIKKGVAVLRQPPGTAKLSTDAGGGQHAVLCEIEVKKNRITTVTVSLLDRPPRCQCANSAGRGKACLS
jgi:hypothetical protein